MSCYLSIDIDYWNYALNRTRKAKAYLDKIALLSRAKGIPIQAMMNHHQMLPLVNKSGATTLINIDTHSDLADDTVEQLNVGTWVSYVKQRRQSHYHWIHGGPLEDGECNSEDPIFPRRGKPHLDLTDWGTLQRTQLDTPPRPERVMRDVVAVGVVLSPSYCMWDLEPVFHSWRKDWEISYLRGVKNERLVRRTLSPK